MPSLRVLVLHGNPVVSKLPQYRKTLILECKALTYLDSRPVFERDRACAEAWKRGGYAEEREENNRWNLKERRKMLYSVNATIRLKNKYRRADDQLSLCSSTDSEKEVQNETDLERTSSLNMQDKIWDEVKNNMQLSESEKEEEEMNTFAVDVENNTTIVNSESPLSLLYDGRDEMNIEVSGLAKDKEELNTNSVESENILIVESKETEDPTVLISETTSNLFEDGKYELSNNLQLLSSENDQKGLNISSAETERILSGESVKEKEIEINLKTELPFNLQDNIEDEIENNNGHFGSEIEEDELDTSPVEAENTLFTESLKVTEDSLIVDSKAPCVLLSDETDEFDNDIDVSVEEVDKVSLDTFLNEAENETIVKTESSLNLQDEMWKEAKNNTRGLSSENEEELMACSIKSEASLQVQEKKITTYSLEKNNYIKDDASSSSQSTDNSAVSSPFISPINSDEEQYTSAKINTDKFDLLDLDNKDYSHSEAKDSDDNSSESNERFSVNGSFEGDFKAEAENIFDRVQHIIEKSTQEIEEINKERLKCIEQFNEIKPNSDLVKEPTQDPIMEEAISMFSKLNLFSDNEISEKESLQMEDKEEASSVKDLLSIDCTGHLYCSCFNDSGSDSDSCLDLKETIKNLQKKETELMQLIRQLNAENEKLSEINKIECSLVESLCTEEQESVNAVCGSIVSEIILDLELDKNAIKNYKIFEAQQNDLESESESDIEEATTSMSNVIHDIQQLVQKYKLISKDEDISTESHNTESSVQSQSNLSWSELINKQYEYIEAKRDRHIQRFVDRVYAQRDKYQDSLEVIDNKLVVVKKDSGQIEELQSATADLSHLTDSDNEHEYFQASDYYKIFPHEELPSGSGDLFEYSSWGLPKQNENISDSGSEYESLPDKTPDACHVYDDLLDKLNMLEITDEQGAEADAETVTQGTSNYAENSNVPLGNEENILLKSLLKSRLSNATENPQLKKLNIYENISINDEDDTDYAEAKPFTQKFQTVENTFLVQQSAKIFEYYGETIEKSTAGKSDDVGKIAPNVDVEDFDDDFYFKTYTPNTQKDVES